MKYFLGQKSERFFKIFLINIIPGLIFLLDFLFKRFYYFHPEFSRDFLFKIIIFKFQSNYNIAFGLRLPYLIMYGLIGLMLILLVVFLVRFYFKKNYVLVFGLTLIFFGAAGNLLDRILYGYVIDYVKILIISVFNLADVMIVAGAGMIVIRQLKQENKKTRKQKNKKF